MTNTLFSPELSLSRSKLLPSNLSYCTCSPLALPVASQVHPQLHSSFDFLYLCVSYASPFCLRTLWAKTLLPKIRFCFHPSPSFSAWVPSFYLSYLTSPQFRTSQRYTSQSSVSFPSTWNTTKVNSLATIWESLPTYHGLEWQVQGQQGESPTEACIPCYVPPHSTAYLLSTCQEIPGGSHVYCTLSGLEQLQLQQFPSGCRWVEDSAVYQSCYTAVT